MFVIVICINGRRYVCSSECYVVSLTSVMCTPLTCATYRCARWEKYVLWEFLI